jgi:hypothetical protein
LLANKGGITTFNLVYVVSGFTARREHKT